MSYQSLVKQSALQPYRKVYIKRRNDSSYESNWYDITNLITYFGTVSWATDDVKFNKFEQGSTVLTAKNDLGQFTEESGNTDSLFAGYLTPYKTLFRIDAGYYDTNGSILPTNTAIFYGILIDDINYKENEATMNINSLTWVINDVSADKVSIPSTITASNLVEAIRDVKDATATGNYLLQPFISSGAWYIQTTTSQYVDFVSTGLNQYSCWSLMERLSETENYITFFGTDGKLYFKNRDVLTSTVAWRFNGPGVIDPDYGVNIIEIKEKKDGWQNIYQRVRIKYSDASTESSYYTSEQDYSVGDGSSSWKYGVRTYDLENTWLNTATAQTIADNIRTSMIDPKKEYSIKTKMITTLNLLDKVTLDYRTVLRSSPPPAYYGSGVWNVDYWCGYSGGIVAQSVTAKIVRMEIDLNNITSTFVIREV